MNDDELRELATQLTQLSLGEQSIRIFIETVRQVGNDSELISERLVNLKVSDIDIQIIFNALAPNYDIASRLNQLHVDQVKLEYNYLKDEFKKGLLVRQDVIDVLDVNPTKPDLNKFIKLTRVRNRNLNTRYLSDINVLLETIRLQFSKLASQFGDVAVMFIRPERTRFVKMLFYDPEYLLANNPSLFDALANTPGQFFTRDTNDSLTKSYISTALYIHYYQSLTLGKIPPYNEDFVSEFAQGETVAALYALATYSFKSNDPLLDTKRQIAIFFKNNRPEDLEYLLGEPASDYEPSERFKFEWRRAHDILKMYYQDDKLSYSEDVMSQ